MPPKSKNFRKTSSALVSRVRKLEIQQKADEKAKERKVYLRNFIASMNSVWSASSRFVLNLTQNATESGRVGNSVNLRALKMNFHIAFPRTTDGAPQVPNSTTRCRLILIHNLHGMETIGIADILENTTYKMTSFFKTDVPEGKRYKLLADYKFNLNANELNDKSIQFRMKLPKSGRVVSYPDDTATVPSDFNVTMFWVCEDLGSLSGNQPTMFYSLKSIYEDA